MNKEEFIKLAVSMGYGDKSSAKKYADRTGNKEFTDNDFVELYHTNMHWYGCKADKDLRSIWGMNDGCRTTAIKNGVQYNSGTRQDWEY